MSSLAAVSDMHGGPRAVRSSSALLVCISFFLSLSFPCLSVALYLCHSQWFLLDKWHLWFPSPSQALQIPMPIPKRAPKPTTTEEGSSNPQPLIINTF